MNIAIIGCGYIGMELAKRLKKEGHSVTATTRKPERVEELARVAQHVVLLRGSSEEELATLLHDNDILIVTVGADDRQDYENAYLNLARTLRRLAQQLALPRRLLYTSSTSVYGDHHGRWVDESAPLLASWDQAKILIETETIYQSLSDLGWHVLIFRLAEIYGPSRELSQKIRRYAGHSLPGNGDSYTNLVHKHDVVSALDYALRHQLTGLYNVTDDDHPTRRELYDHLAVLHRTKRVAWDPTHPNLHSGNKRVSNHKLKSEGFSLHHPHHLYD